jgi:poly(3-hydroxybutyrate) depolymerase
VREYYVQLPAGYDQTKAYPLLVEGPGCGGNGNNLYALPDLAGTVIRVGLSPSVDAQAFHSTNPGQGCFDDKEGDDSVDWPFYEGVYDQLAATVCFDKNRVFAAGNSSGAWLANELGCKYAGDAARPIRGIMANTGGLPTDPRYVPTCTTKPMAGFWSWQAGDLSQASPTGNIIAINRALKVNGCTPDGVSYANGTFSPFPISSGDGTSCKKFNGCPDLYPLVVCATQGGGHVTADIVVNPGWATFIQLFSAPPVVHGAP